MKHFSTIVFTNLLVLSSLSSDIGYIVNEGDNTVYYFNPISNIVSGSFSTGFSPISIAIGTATGTVGYIVNNGTNTASTLSLFDASTSTALSTTIPVGINPDAIVINGTTGYVVNFVDRTVSIFNALTGSNPYATISTQGAPRAISFYGTTGFVANSGSNTLTVFDATTQTTLGNLAVGTAPYAIAFYGTTGYVANSGANTLSLFDASHPLTAPYATLNVGLTPFDIGIYGTTGYVVNNGSNTLSVFDASAATAPYATLSVGSGPRSISFLGSNGYVVNSDANTLSVFDAANHTTPATTITTGLYPQQVAFITSTSGEPATWSGAVNADWLTSGNWTTLPLAGSIAHFPSLSGGTYTVNIAGTTPTAGYLNFEASGYSLTAGSSNSATDLLTLNPTINGTAIYCGSSTSFNTVQITLSSGGYFYLAPDSSNILTNNAAIFGNGVLFDIAGSGLLTISNQAQLGAGLSLNLSQGSCINNDAYLGLNGPSLVIVNEAVTNENGAFLGKNVGTITLSTGAIIDNGTASYLGYEAGSIIISGAELTQDASSFMGPAPLSLLSGTIQNDGIIYTGAIVDGVYQSSASYLLDGAILGNGELYLAKTNIISTPITQGTVYVGYGATNNSLPITPGTVSGFLELNNLLDAAVIVTGSGVLLGNGTISGPVTVNAGGLLSPGVLGGYSGQLHLAGTTALNAESILRMDFDNSGQNDLLAIGSGSDLIIDPLARLYITASPGFVAKESFYSLIELSSGSLSGTFTLDPLPSAFKYYTLEYSTSSLSDTAGTNYLIGLVYHAPPASVGLTGQTPNAITVASTLNSLSGHTNSCLQSKIDLMSTLSSPELSTVLNQLEPSALKAQQVVLEELNFVINHELSDKLYMPMMQDEENELLTQTPTSWKPFIIAGYDRFNLKSYSQYAGAKTNAAYQLAGFSAAGPHYNLTTAVGSSQTFTRYTTVPSSSQSISVLGSFGAAGFWGEWVFGAEGLFSYNWLQTKRPINQFALQANSNHQGYNLKGELHAAYTHSFKKFSLGPYDTLAYQYASEGAFTETGAQCLNLNVSASSQHVLRNSLGLNFAATTTPELNPFIDLAYVFEKRYGGFNYQTSFTDTNIVMLIEGLRPTKQYLQVLFGFKGTKKSWEYSLKYNGQFGKRFLENGVNFSVGYRF